jgi:hypothetical protein
MAGNWAANYEGGKIVDYAQQSKLLAGYANIQLAMDAPFFGRTADTDARRAAPGGRVELTFPDYDEGAVLTSLKEAFSAIREKQGRTHMLYLFQVARGTAAAATKRDLLVPAMNAAGITDFGISTGYRSANYFRQPKRPFTFVNVGMAASLSKTSLPTGELCVPATSHDVRQRENGQMWVGRMREHKDDLLVDAGFTAINLFGIEDDMPFITEENYPDGHRWFSALAAGVSPFVWQPDSLKEPSGGSV